MLDKFNKYEITEIAIKAFEKNFLDQTVRITQANEQNLNTLNRPDLILNLNTPNKEIVYFVVVKNNITKPIIGNLLMLKKQFNQPLLLITNHVTNFIADNLKQENIEFIDTGGNGFINQFPVLFYVKGNLPPAIYRHIPKNRAFKNTGLKIIFALLYDKELINKPYRAITDCAGVALGAVGTVIQDLIQLGYLVKMNNKNLQLVQKEKLVERWKTEYAEKLRPKLLLGKYTGNLLKVDFDKENIRIGGETAAEIITNYLKPQITTLYIKKEYLNDFLLNNRLKKDENGIIEIYDFFWKPKENDNEKTTPHILVYADLLANGNQRNIEIAELIYNEYINKYIREN